MMLTRESVALVLVGVALNLIATVFLLLQGRRYGRLTTAVETMALRECQRNRADLDSLKTAVQENQTEAIDLVRTLDGNLQERVLTQMQPLLQQNGELREQMCKRWDLLHQEMVRVVSRLVEEECVELEMVRTDLETDLESLRSELTDASDQLHINLDLARSELEMDWETLREELRQSLETVLPHDSCPDCGSPQRNMAPEGHRRYPNLINSSPSESRGWTAVPEAESITMIQETLDRFLQDKLPAGSSKQLAKRIADGVRRDFEAMKQNLVQLAEAIADEE